MTTSTLFPATIRIGILVYQGFEPIDVWGFAEAFTRSRFIGTGFDSPPPYPFEIVLTTNLPANTARPAKTPNRAGPYRR